MDKEPRTAKELLDDAALGFAKSYTFAPKDAEILRIGGADMFEEGVSQLLQEKLTSLGLTLDEIDGLTKDHLLTLAPDAMAEIRQRTAALDTLAKRALEEIAYYTERKFGQTQND